MAASGVARSEENDGLCKSYVERILVGSGYGWGVCGGGEGWMDGVRERRRRKQLRGQIEPALNKAACQTAARTANMGDGLVSS